jgi:hypothetical protein
MTTIQTVTVPVQFASDPEISAALKDLGKALVRLASALGADTPAEEPDFVRDRDGDVWTRRSDGLYTFGSLVPRPLENVRHAYGPLNEEASL